MNGLKHPASHQFNIVLETVEDRIACRRALGIGGIGYEKLLALDRRATPSVIETEITAAVAQNLAHIALGNYGESGFSGLSQAEADQKIRELSGDVDDFFQPILR